MSKQLKKWKKCLQNNCRAYLEIDSTVEELERYYDNRTLDKSRQDVQNFKLFKDRTKNNLFEYIIKLISEGNLKVSTFKKLPMEIRTEFFEYVIAQECDLKKLLIDLGLCKCILERPRPNFMYFFREMLSIAPPHINWLQNNIGTIEPLQRFVAW